LSSLRFAVLLAAPATAALLALAPPLRQVAPSVRPAEVPTTTYFVAEGERGSGFLPADRDLAIWALEAWNRSAGGALRLEAARESDALLRVYWVAANGSTYGETRPVEVGGRRGAAVFVRPDIDALGLDVAGRAAGDPLWRDTIVYLTCLHELGHALGLSHTADERDVMYFFGYGGDVVEFFARYRRQLRAREDMRSVSGLSDGDVQALRAALR
jgi:hypothetical protein